MSASAKSSTAKSGATAPESRDEEQEASILAELLSDHKETRIKGFCKLANYLVFTRGFSRKSMCSSESPFYIGIQPSQLSHGCNNKLISLKLSTAKKIANLAKGAFPLTAEVKPVSLLAEWSKERVDKIMSTARAKSKKINTFDGGQRVALLADINALAGKKLTDAQLQTKLSNLWRRDPRFGNPSANVKRGKKKPGAEAGADDNAKAKEKGSTKAKARGKTKAKSQQGGTKQKKQKVVVTASVVL